MTLNELIDKITEEIEKVCEKDESKYDIFTELNEMIISAQNENKIDGCKLFETCNKLNSMFPDYVSAMFALSIIAKIGIDSGIVEQENVTDVNISDIVTGID